MKRLKKKAEGVNSLVDAIKSLPANELQAVKQKLIDDAKEWISNNLSDDEWGYERESDGEGGSYGYNYEPSSDGKAEDFFEQLDLKEICEYALEGTENADLANSVTNDDDDVMEFFSDLAYNDIVEVFEDEIENYADNSYDPREDWEADWRRSRGV